MPIYEYRCSACGHYLEALQKMSEGPLRKCPECGKSQLKRLVSAPQFRLKGSGWYETDFKNKNETQRNLVEKRGAEPSEPAGDKSTDTSVKAEAGKVVAEA
jgi:putative FmdB family regulatory protein